MYVCIILVLICNKTLSLLTLMKKERRIIDEYMMIQVVI